jgi:hypothetical protein
MSWLTKKGPSEPRQLLEKARRTLGALNVTLHRQHYEHGSSVEPQSWDYKRIPLEYRKMVGSAIDTLVYYVYDHHAGKDVETLSELAQALAAVQTALTDPASISDETVKRRQALRAQTVADLLALVEDRRAFGHGPVDPFSRAHLDRLSADCDEALTWFKSQSELDTALRYLSEMQKRNYPRVLLAHLEDARALLRSQQT